MINQNNLPAFDFIKKREMRNAIGEFSMYPLTLQLIFITAHAISRNY